MKPLLLTAILISIATSPVSATANEYFLNKQPVVKLETIAGSSAYFVVEAPGKDFSGICAISIRSSEPTDYRLSALIVRLGLFGLLGDNKVFNMTHAGDVRILMPQNYIDGVEIWTLDGKSFADNIHTLYGTEGSITVQAEPCQREGGGGWGTRIRT
ncbi:MAG: hypothetical protein V4534_08365 [Myxococcota bacterium]